MARMADQTMGPALHLLVWNSVYISAAFRRTNFRVTPDLLFYWLWLHGGFLMQRSHKSVSLPKGNSGQMGWYTSTMIKRMQWCAGWLQDQTFRKHKWQLQKKKKRESGIDFPNVLLWEENANQDKNYNWNQFSFVIYTIIQMSEVKK